MRRSLRAMLTAEGYDVREASDGVTALASAREDPPAAVVLDLHVPGLDGRAVLRGLRDDPSTAGVPVIVVTATGSEERRDLAALGAAGYLTKPFDPPALLELVARVLPAGGRAGA